jgi:hypothetical protein
VVWEVSENSFFKIYNLKYLANHQRIYWNLYGEQNEKSFVCNIGTENNLNVVCKTELSFNLNDFAICKKDPSIAFVRTKDEKMIFKITLNMSGEEQPMQVYSDDEFKKRLKDPEQETLDHTEIKPIIELSERIYWFSIGEKSENLYFNNSFKIIIWNLSEDKGVTLNLRFNYLISKFTQFKNLFIR